SSSAQPSALPAQHTQFNMFNSTHVLHYELSSTMSSTFNILCSACSAQQNLQHA
ncbi:hypothetical protein A2U01_0109986, partial [Trifolium medium]|nr:hypothetical protein [Trifolium medium]